MAGGWPNIPAKKAVTKAADCCSQQEQTTQDKAAKTEPRMLHNHASTYEYLGAEGGAQLAPHRIEWRDGGFTHAADCPRKATATFVRQTAFTAPNDYVSGG